MCSTVIPQLGFECHPIDKTLRITSSLTYCDDREHIGVSIRGVNDRYLVSDRCDALMNMEARGILLTKKQLDKIRQLLFKEGAELNVRGEITARATEKDADAITSNVIRTGILASTLSLDWYQPVQAEKFESIVVGCLYHTELRDALSFYEGVYGLSGHQVTVPVTIKTDIPKYVFTSNVKHGGSWNSTYSLLGKLIDPKTSGGEYNDKFIVIDSKAIGDQVQQLSLLFHKSSQVLPFSKGEIWVKRPAV